HPLEARVGLVPEAGIEPACLAARDFKSLVSTDFTTRARCDAALYRMLSPARWPGLDPAPPAWQRTVARLRRLRVPERRHARLPGWRCRCSGSHGQTRPADSANPVAPPPRGCARPRPGPPASR